VVQRWEEGLKRYDDGSATTWHTGMCDKTFILPHLPKTDMDFPLHELLHNKGKELLKWCFVCSRTLRSLWKSSSKSPYNNKNKIVLLISFASSPLLTSPLGGEKYQKSSKVLLKLRFLRLFLLQFFNLTQVHIENFLSMLGYITHL
jgi:hypothetical protein